MNSLVNLEQRVFLSAILLGGSLTDYYNVIDRNYNMGSGYSIKNNTILDFGRYGMFALNMHLYQIFTWKDVKVFMLGQYILMHSVIYRTELLRQCNFELPKHTFYVDNIFVFQPLPYVKTMYYLDVNFYRYFIGRTDQSVNETVMIGRIDQQIRVTKLMLDYYENSRITSHKLRHYMVRYLEIMMVICSILAIKSGTDENMAKKKELWESVKKKDVFLYMRLRYGFLGQSMNLPGKSGRQVSIAGYKISQKFFGFN